MPIDPSEVEVGAIYSAGEDHIRKVVAIEEGENGNQKVVYKRKSAKIPKRDFDYGHNKTQPPSIDTFSSDCHKKLDEEEIRKLIIDGVLTREEVEN
jgi:hypothetical protein